MIESFELHNYKSHVSTRIELGRLTALAGPNGSGKTALLEALNWAAGRIKDINMPRPSNRGRDGDEEWSYGLKIVVEGNAVHLASKSGGSVANMIQGISEGHARYWRDWNRAHPSLLQNARYLSLSSLELGAPSYLAETETRIRPNGYGLASFLADLMTSDPEAVETILEQIRQVLPFVHRFRARRAKIEKEQLRSISVDGKSIAYPDKQEVIGHELLVDVDGAEQLPASQLSEGTLLVIGLLTILCGPDRPNLLLLDDIDRGLHPGAQRQLMRLLRKILEQNPDLQVVLTTHSPYVIDEMAADEVWILAADSEGATHARRLSDHPDAAEALQVLSTGEFLDAEGEAWVLQESDAPV